MASVAGAFRFDEDAVGRAASGMQVVSDEMASLRVRCQKHQQEAHGLLGALRQMVNVEIDLADWGFLWDQLGFNGFRAELEATREILGQQKVHVDGYRQLLEETHSGTLAQRLDDELAPLSGSIQSCHNNVTSTNNQVAVENLAQLFLGVIDLPLMIGGLMGELSAIQNEAETVYGILNWLAQAEFDLLHLRGTPFRDLWLHFSSGSPSAAGSHSGLQVHTNASGSPLAVVPLDTTPSQADTLVARARELAEQLQANPHGIYNILKNADPTELKVLGIDPADWSTTDVECVAFVWLTYSALFPPDKMNTILQHGNAGDEFWNAYKTDAAYKQGWRVIPNGQPPQHPRPPSAQPLQAQSQSAQALQPQGTITLQDQTPPAQMQPPPNGPQRGDILVIQFTDSKGHDIYNNWGSYGHVAIITNVTYNAQMDPTSFTIVQSNTPGVKGAPTTSPTQAIIQVNPTTGYASMPDWLGGGRILGYVRYAPGTP